MARQKRCFTIDKIGDTFVYIHKSIRKGSVFLYNGKKVKIMQVMKYGAEFCYWEKTTCTACNHTKGRYNNIPYFIMASEFDELKPVSKK